MMIAVLSSLLLLWQVASGLGNDLHNQRRITCILPDAHSFIEFQRLADTLEADVWTEAAAAFPAAITLRIHKDQVDTFSQLYNCPMVKALPVWRPSFQHKRLLLTSQEFFQDYRSFAEQEAYLKRLATSYPSQVTIHSIGKSLEGRDLWVAHINTTGDASHKSIWVNGGQHAREWLSPAAALSLIEWAAKNPASLPKYNLIVAFNINPDGYEQSRLVNRYWRKNKRHNADGSIGVDLNRNWNFKWNQINGGGHPSSDVYPGTGPNSEPEIALTSQYILSQAGKIAAGVDVHTYGELVLRNYGWTTQPCRDETQFKKIGDAMARAAQQVNQEPYRSQLSAGLYPTSGSADDWFYEVGGFPGFTFEMRDTGAYGFVTPRSYIIPNNAELAQAILALHNSL